MARNLLDPVSINPGTLSRVAVFSAPASADAFGQPDVSYTSYYTARASIRLLTDRETVASNQVAERGTHLITIRYPASPIVISPGHRIAMDGHTYLVQTPDNVFHASRVMNITVMEVSGNG